MQVGIRIHTQRTTESRSKRGDAAVNDNIGSIYCKQENDLDEFFPVNSRRNFITVHKFLRLNWS
nr:hypothetical protein Iba_chr01dCG10390 [Ipomoea batatas]GMD00374.1 hypothetical protein Iba_chr05eCG14640 [Ipomoea batatas]